MPKNLYVFLNHYTDTSYVTHENSSVLFRLICFSRLANARITILNITIFFHFNLLYINFCEVVYLAVEFDV